MEEEAPSVLGRFQFRGDSAQNLQLANPVLWSREICIEIDTMQFKIGNGIDPWNELPYGGLQGEQGPAGGPQGPRGFSAFELAQQDGFNGTIEEWLASLEGPSGLSAYQIAVNNGFVGTEAEWLQSLKGDSGTQSADVGDIRILHDNAIKTKWLECDGGVYNIAPYSQLAAFLGTTVSPYGDLSIPAVSISGIKIGPTDTIRFGGYFISFVKSGKGGSSVYNSLPNGTRLRASTNIINSFIGGITFGAEVGAFPQGFGSSSIVRLFKNTSGNRLMAVERHIANAFRYVVWNNNINGTPLFEISQTLRTNTTVGTVRAMESYGDHVYIFTSDNNLQRVWRLHYTSTVAEVVWTDAIGGAATNLAIMTNKHGRISLVFKAGSEVRAIHSVNGTDWSAGSINVPFGNSLADLDQKQYSFFPTGVDSLISLGKCAFSNNTSYQIVTMSSQNTRLSTTNGIDWIATILALPLRLASRYTWIGSTPGWDFWVNSSVLINHSVPSSSTQQNTGNQGLQVSSFNGSNNPTYLLDPADFGQTFLQPRILWNDDDAALMTIDSDAGNTNTGVSANTRFRCYPVFPLPINPNAQFRVPFGTASPVTSSRYFIKALP